MCFQDFGLNARRKENLNPKKRKRVLYSRLKTQNTCQIIAAESFTFFYFLASLS